MNNLQTASVYQENKYIRKCQKKNILIKLKFKETKKNKAKNFYLSQKKLWRIKHQQGRMKLSK